MDDVRTRSPGFVLWLMGPTSAGKTTIAKFVKSHLRESGIPVMHFDGDEVRDFFGADLGFKPEDRQRVVRTLIHLSNKSARAGISTIVSALTANPDSRELVKREVENLIVGHVHCPIELCAERDPKGLYARAKRGEIDTLIGFNSPYLPPENPDITIESGTQNPRQSAEMIASYLQTTGWLVQQ